MKKAMSKGTKKPGGKVASKGKGAAPKSKGHNLGAIPK